jgi:metallo-beta-lactamase class B
MKKIVSTIIVFFFLTTIFGQVAEPALKISHLTGDFYIFTSANLYKGSPVPANGMYLVTNKGVVMFDTPFDTTRVQPLLDSIKIKHHMHVVMCIATHSHSDRTGGLEFLRQNGVKTYTTRRTDELSKIKNEKRAEFLFDNDTTFTVGQYSFETFYGGEGHTTDNIVIWFEKFKILYGGCLIKSVEADDLGNLADANVNAWESTIKNIQNKFVKPKYIIPGHFGWESEKALEHTLKLIEQYKEKNTTAKPSL